jgi:hypothetical protein
MLLLLGPLPLYPSDLWCCRSRFNWMIDACFLQW